MLGYEIKAGHEGEQDNNKRHHPFTVPLRVAVKGRVSCYMSLVVSIAFVTQQDCTQVIGKSM